MTPEEEQALKDKWIARTAEDLKIETPYPLILEFSRESDRREFLGYLSDGGGEYQFMTMLEETEGRRVAFLYHDIDLTPLTEGESRVVKVIARRDS